MSDPEADLELVKAALAEDPQARDALVERMRCIPRILHARNLELGARLGRDELKDLEQETFAQIWKRIDRYEGRGPLEAWVYRFCVYTELNAWQRHRRRPVALEERHHDDAQLVAGQDFDQFELHETVRRALVQIDEDERRVIELHHLEQLTFVEVGQRLQVSPNSAKSRYYRGIERLRGKLRALGEGDAS